MAKQKITKQKVTFSYNAPDAQTVSVAGDFTSWDQAPVSLKKDKSGRWKKTVSLATGRYEYRLIVDGEWKNDPQCSLRQPNQFGTENCICIVEAPAAKPSLRPTA
jgi:1,4-alpha-glucan branching enzyme